MRSCEARRGWDGRASFSFFRMDLQWGGRVGMTWRNQPTTVAGGNHGCAIGSPRSTGEKSDQDARLYTPVDAAKHRAQSDTSLACTEGGFAWLGVLRVGPLGRIARMLRSVDASGLERPDLVATQHNQVKSRDITKMRGRPKWSFFHRNVITDIFSRYVVGRRVGPRKIANLQTT